jgi:hypothetical protein
MTQIYPTTCGQRKLAAAAGVSLSELSAVLLGKRRSNCATLAKLYRAVSRLESDAREQAGHVQEVLVAVRDQCQRTSVRQFAKQAKLDEANLAHVLSSRRKLSQVMLTRLEVTFSQASKRP